MNKISAHKDLVRNVFSRVAGKYNMMNDAMSFGLHRLWKQDFVSRVVLKPHAKYMDLAAGTGDITRLVYKAVTKRGIAPNIVAVDPSEEMINEGKANLINGGIVQGIEWVMSAAEELPFESSSFDAITIAFGLRNVTDINAALKECFRVLKPGGQFLCLEFSKVQNEALNKIYQAYSKLVIPKIGSVVAKDQKAYEYLVKSIDEFDSQIDLQNKFESVGFKTVTYTNLTQGIVAIHEGWKE